MSFYSPFKLPSSMTHALLKCWKYISLTVFWISGLIKNRWIYSYTSSSSPIYYWTVSNSKKMPIIIILEKLREVLVSDIVEDRNLFRIPTLPHFETSIPVFEVWSPHYILPYTVPFLWNTTQAITYASTASPELSHRSYWTWCGAEGSQGTLSCAKNCGEP